MATRIYLPSSGAAPVTPSTWNHPNTVTTTYTYAGVLQKISSAFASRTSATGIESPIYKGVLRYVIGPLSAAQISGTVKLVQRVSESAIGANANLSIAVKIIQPNGSDRSVLLAYTSSDLASAPYEMTTTLSVKYAYSALEVYPIGLTSQTPTLGDYLVIEIGFRSATTTTRAIVHRIGDAVANDCPETVGGVNDYCPWVEFSNGVGFIKSIAGSLAASASISVPTIKRTRRIGGVISAALSAVANLTVIAGGVIVNLAGSFAATLGMSATARKLKRISGGISAFLRTKGS